jgi:hypothetical protein
MLPRYSVIIPETPFWKNRKREYAKNCMRRILELCQVQEKVSDYALSFRLESGVCRAFFRLKSVGDYRGCIK